MELVAYTTPSHSRSSSDMSSSLSSLSSLEEEEELDQSQSSEPSSSPSTSVGNSNDQESRSRSPNSAVEAPSTLISSDPDDGEAPDTKVTAQTQAHAQHTKMEDNISQRKDSTQRLQGDDLRVSEKPVEAIREGLGTKDSPLTLPPTSTQDHIESDRKEEFEKNSSLGRAAARQKAEHTSLDGRSEECSESRFDRESTPGPMHTHDGVAKDDKTDLTGKGPKPTEHKSKIEGNVGEHAPAEPKIKVEPRVQSSWVKEAFSACKENKKVRKSPHSFARCMTD
jgi:hypothetical protein